MKLSFAVVCAMALGASAAPALVPREASGRLAIKVSISVWRVYIYINHPPGHSSG